MAETKTKPTGASVDAYLASRASPEQLADCKAIMAMCKRVTKQQPKMWGPSIVGYGSYTYRYESGHSGDACLAGFAVRGKEVVVYLIAENPEQVELLARLGRHKMGKACLYFKRLTDLDVKVLEALIAGSVAEVKRRYPHPPRRLTPRSTSNVGQTLTYYSMRNLGPLRVLALIAALGCPTSETTDQLASETTPKSAGAVVPTPWYRGARALDLTGDGLADSVRLEALGASPDSLDITLSFVVEAEEKHREPWGSSDELAHLDSADRVPPRVDVILRAQLDSVLASVVVQRLDASGVQLMAEDRAVLAGLDPRPTHRVSFSYGYETTARLVWDAPRKRFVRLWSCC